MRANITKLINIAGLDQQAVRLALRTTGSGLESVAIYNGLDDVAGIFDPIEYDKLHGGGAAKRALSTLLNIGAQATVSAPALPVVRARFPDLVREAMDEDDSGEGAFGVTMQLGGKPVGNFD